MSKYELILTLCKKKGVKITKVEEELGFARGSFKKMDSSKPSAEKIYALAKYFDVPMEYFFEENKPLRLLKPVYEVAAGEGRINSDYTDNYISFDEDSDEYTYCSVHGDSMYPIVQSGDIIKIRLTSEISPSDLTVIKIDGESATVKYVEIVQDGLWIRAENKEVFEDRFYSVKDVMTLPITIVGKAVELQRAL